MRIRPLLCLWLCLALTAGARAEPEDHGPGAVDLFAFREAVSGRVLAFPMPTGEPISATVDQAGAMQVAVDWARQFYRLNELDVLAVDFEVRPTRFWRVTFSASEKGQPIRLYAVVLPDGHVVVPIIRDQT